jgi:hypothetical protein
VLLREFGYRIIASQLIRVNCLNASIDQECPRISRVSEIFKEHLFMVTHKADCVGIQPSKLQDVVNHLSGLRPPINVVSEKHQLISLRIGGNLAHESPKLIQISVDVPDSKNPPFTH